MPQVSLGAVDLYTDWPSFSFWSRVNVPADWELGPARSTAVRDYGGKVLEFNNFGMRVREGTFKDWRFDVGSFQVFDREWIYFIPDNFYARDIQLTAPDQVNFSTGTIGSLGSIDFNLTGAKGIGQYLTMLPGINSGTSPAAAEDLARLERLQKASKPYLYTNWLGQTRLDEGKALKDQEYKAALDAVTANNKPNRLQGLFSVEAREASFKLFDDFNFSVTGTSEQPGFRAEYSLDYDPISNSDRLLDNRAYVSLENVQTSFKIGGSELFSLTSTSIPDRPDVVIRAGNWGLRADDPLFSIEQLSGHLTVLPFVAADGTVVYPNITVSGLEVQQDQDLSLRGARIDLPQGAVSTLGLAGIVPFEFNTLDLAFEPEADGSVDLKKTTLRVTGRINLALLQEQLRRLTASPALTLSASSWSGSKRVPLSPDQTLALGFRLDPRTGALKILDAPALRIDLQNLVVPQPGGTQSQLGGTLLLGGTDAVGRSLAIPEALLVDAGVVNLLPDNFTGVQALLAGDISAPDGTSKAAALLSGSISNSRQGSSIQLNGQVRLEGSLLSSGLSLGGALEATLNWQLEAQRSTTGALQLKGFPTIEGVGLQNASFAVDGVLRLAVDQLAWFATPQTDPLSGSSGLIARARGVNLTLLKGALAGQAFVSDAAEVLLFDLKGNDGVPDHFYVDGLELSLPQAKLGPLSAEGLRLQLTGLSNLPDPKTGASRLRGAITLEAANAELQVGATFSGAIVPPRAASTDTSSTPEDSTPPALQGRLDLANGDLSLDLQRFEAALELGGQEALTLEANGGSAGGALRLELKAANTANTAVLSIPNLTGAMPLLAVDSLKGRLAPAIQVQGLALQQDGDLELAGISLSLPPGYSRQWSLGGLLPLELQELGVRFAPRADRSADLSQPLISLRGVLDVDLLELQLRSVLQAPELDLNLARYGRDGRLLPIEGTAELSLEARLDANTGSLKLLNSPGWQLQLDDLPVPIPGNAAPLLAGDLLLPPTDAQGNLLPLPSTLVNTLIKKGGVSAVTVDSLLTQPPQVLGLLQGSMQLKDGTTDTLFAASGGLLLSGSITPSENGGSRLSLAGEAVLSPKLRFQGLSADADLSTSFLWDLISTPGADGEISLTGTPRLSGTRIKNVDLNLDDRLTVQVQSLSWTAEPQLDQIGDAVIPGLIAHGQGVNLTLTAGPLAGLRFGSPDNQVRLYDLKNDDGLIDHFYVDGEAVAIENLNLGWLKATRLGLELKGVTNLPALDSTPNDDNSLSGLLDLSLEQAQLGTSLRFDHAGGDYDLGRGSLNLSLEALTWSGGGLELTGAGVLRLDPSQPRERWLQLNAEGSLQPGLPGLGRLEGDMTLYLNPDLKLTEIEGNLNAEASDGWLGDLQLSSDLSYSYAAATNLVTLRGTVRLAGADADATIRFKPGESGFEAALSISNQTPLALADWLQLTPKDLELLYTYNPQQGGLLTVDGQAGLSFLDRSVDVAADLQLGFSAADHQAHLLGGGLQLQQPLEGLNLAGFGIDLIADRAGNLPGIQLDNTPGGVLPRLTGAVRLKDLKDLTIQLDPQSGLISYTSDGWSFDRFNLDLTPSGALDLGLLELGDAASLRYADGTFTLNPDLSLNGALLGQVLAPVAQTIDNTITPISKPVVDVLLSEINLDLLKNLQSVKPSWAWDWTWSPVVDTGRNLHSALLRTFEETPGNLLRDGVIQVAELLDSSSYSFYKLLKQNPTLGKSLAAQLGLPSSYVEAVNNGAPFVSVTGAIKTLQAISELASAVKQAEASAALTGAGDFVAIPDLSFSFRPGALSETLGSIGGAATEDSAVIKALLDVQRAWQATATPSPDQAGDSASALFSVDTGLTVPLINDPLTSVLTLLKGDPLDLMQFDLGLGANLSFELNQSIPIPIGPVVLPLVLGGKARLSGELNASLGLTTSTAALKHFASELASDISLAGVASAVSGLLAPVESDALGLYMAGRDDKPLLRLEPEVRIEGGLDAGVAGVRAFAGLKGSLDIQLAQSRIYLGELVKSLSGSTPPTPEVIGRLLSLDASATAQFGIDTKILNWENLITKDLPLYNLSVPRVAAGPITRSSVFLDERRYDDTGSLSSNLNLQADSGEFVGQTDSQGAYRFDGSPNPERIGNRDGVLDYRDGMMIAGQRNGQTSGQRFSLVDSITGVDLGIPLVGVPGGPINLGTTLKYTNLIRWRPDKTLGGQPLTPKLITNLFAGIVKDAPASFQDDSFEAYKAIASGDEQVAELGRKTLIFAYQHLAAVLTIKAMLNQFELDYSETKAWGFRPDASGIDSADVVAFGAYGFAIRSRFGATDAAGGNPLDPLHRAPLAAQYDVTNRDHLRAVLSEILAWYPTKTLLQSKEIQAETTQEPRTDAKDPLRRAFIATGRTDQNQSLVNEAVENRFGRFLDHSSEGLGAITTTIAERLNSLAQLDAQIPIAGSQLTVAGIAGPKRLVIQQLIPALIKTAQLKDHKAFQQHFYSQFYSPQTVDSLDRVDLYWVKASTSSSQQRSTLNLNPGDQPDKAIVTVSLTDEQGQPVEAPDSGLAVRFRLGGSAVLGRDYTLDERHNSHLIYVEPGQTEAALSIQIKPDFYAAPNRYLQVELLSAEAGYGINRQAAVVNIQADPQLAPQPVSPETDEARSRFQPHHLYQAQSLSGREATVVNAVDGINGVLRGRPGKADVFVLRPVSGSVLHLENLRLLEGDQLLIDPLALQEFRRASSGTRVFSASAERQALQRLEEERGRDVVLALSADERKALLDPLLDALEPLPPVQLDQLMVSGGILYDLVTRLPLALVSDHDKQDGDQAYSSLSADPTYGFIKLLESDELAASLRPIETITTEDRTTDAARTALRQSGVTLDREGVAVKVETRSAGTGTQLAIALDGMAADLGLANRKGQRREGRALSYYTLNQEGAIAPLLVDPIHESGARLFDRNGDRIADLVTLSLQDGDIGDSDQTVNGTIDLQATAAVVSLDPAINRLADGQTLRIVDPTRPTIQAQIVLQADLIERPGTTHQIGYVVVAGDKPLQDLAMITADLTSFRSRAKVLFSALGRTDTPLPAASTDVRRDIILGHGQSLRFFEIRGAVLEDISSLDDPRLHFLQTATPHANGRGVRVRSKSGLAFNVELSEGDPGLNALIGQQQSDAAVLDFSSFTPKESIEGTIRVSGKESLDSSIGFYRTVDHQGGVLDASGRIISPGDADYAAAALRPENRVKELDNLQASSTGTSTSHPHPSAPLTGFRSLKLKATTLIAPYAQVGADALFAYGAANSDGIPHFVTLGENRLGFEATLGGANRSYDEFVMAFDFTTVMG